MANNFIQSAAVIVDAYLVRGKYGGRIIYQNSTWGQREENTFASLFSAVGLCFSIFLYVLFHSSISLSNVVTLPSANCRL